MAAESAFDVAIVGAGIVGLATAAQLLAARPGLAVAVFERESEVGLHQTSHNSGVVHSGVYYRPGSLKAELCVRGRRELRCFADTHAIPWQTRGKLIVAITRSELPHLRELEERARHNGVRTELVGRRGIRDHEPQATGIAALWVPGTAVTDFAALARAMAADVTACGAVIRLDTPVESLQAHRSGHLVVTSHGSTRARCVVVCAGTHGDRVIRTLSLRGADAVMIVPVRGSYRRLTPPSADLVRGLIYPVPIPELPFLGVHLTRHVDDTVTAGPNAQLALSRDGYSARTFSGEDVRSLLRFPGFWRLVSHQARTAVIEAAGMSRHVYANRLRRYLPEVRARDLTHGPAGVRAQVVDRRGRLLDDFVITASDHDDVIAVLSAPSPAATASLAIGEQIAARTLASLKR